MVDLSGRGYSDAVRDVRRGASSQETGGGMNGEGGENSNYARAVKAARHQHTPDSPRSHKSSFFFQLGVTMKRILILQYRAPIAFACELMIPIIFVVGSIVLWVIITNDTFPASDYFNVFDVTLTDFVMKKAMSMLCYNATLTGGAAIAALPECGDFVATFASPPQLVCAEDNLTGAPVGLCVEGNVANVTYLAMRHGVQTGTTSIPTLDQMIVLQWVWRILFQSFGLKWPKSKTVDAAMLSSGALFFTPQSAETEALVAHFRNTSAYFPYIYGGTFATVAGAEARVKSRTFHDPPNWGIIEVSSLTADNFDVAIRLNATALPRTKKILSEYYVGGIAKNGAAMYILSGFTTLQHVVYEYFLSNVAGTAKKPEKKVLMLPAPTRAYKDEQFLSYGGQFVPLIIVLGFLYPVSQMTKRVVLEKELRLREAMLIMGLSETIMYTAWFLIYMVQYAVVSLVIAILLRTTYLTRSDFGIVFATFFFFSLSLITLSGLIAVFFSKARLASILAPLIYFALAIPLFTVQNLQGPPLIGLSFLSPSGLSVAVKLIFAHELSGGMKVSGLIYFRDTPKLLLVMLILLVDFLLYLVLMLYLHAVLPKQWGTRKHPLFFIIEPARRFCCRSDAPHHENMEDGRAEDGVFEEIGEGDADYAVSIVGLRKEYRRGGKKFVAVNNLYWGMREGEISVLLGHNGAGKTTTMNMMTGMVEPDEGDCYIYGYSVREEQAKARQQIGYCPQHNILWPSMTCYEHLWYYASIKGLRGAEREKAISRMLASVDLTDKRNYRSKRLSGGQKRKLSVAIAFVGGSRLVFLDEPTAGMDVGARRHTWGLLRSMSKHHSILLSTHFMDEADLLGDSIAIMSKGRLQCAGSNMFLKSKLGVGYVLTLSVVAHVNRSAIASVVRKYVPSATRLGSGAGEMGFRLPMETKATFPTLLAEIEEHGSELGVNAYSVSATTLEEIFIQVAQQEGAKEEAERTRPYSTAPDTVPAYLTSATGTCSSGNGIDVLTDPGVVESVSRELLQQSDVWSVGLIVSELGLLYSQFKGHKIGIMSRGCIKCSGSSMFLKSRLGVGYNMNISIDPEVEAADIDRLVLSFVPSAEAMTFNGCEIVYKMPLRDLQLFPSLLAGLEENGEAAGVRGYSLSATTLEEVFLQIALDEMESHTASSAVADNPMVQEEDNAVWNCEIMTRTREQMMSQFKAMMMKRLRNALRDRRMQCFQVVCPVVCIILAMLLTLVGFAQTGSIDLSSGMFGETVQMQVSGCEPYFGATNGATRQGSYITDLNFSNASDLSLYATDTAKHLTMPRYTSLFCGDAGLHSVIPLEMNATFLFYNTSAYHSAGVVLQQLYTYILQSFTDDSGRTLKTGVKLMPDTASDLGVRGGVQTILIGAIVMIPFTFLPSNVVAWVVKERECKARHLQNVSGLSFYIYWFTNFLFDIAAYVITLILVLLIFLMFGRKEYVGKNTTGPTILVLLVYGFCSTASAYVLSFGFAEHSTAQSVTMAASFVTGFLLVMMVFILSLVDATKRTSEKLRWPFRLVPSYCMGESIINLAMDRQQAVLNLPSNPWGMDVVGWPCVFMIVEFPIFLLATLFIDHPWRRLWGQKSSYNRGAPAEVIDGEDSDVEDERKEVYQQELRNVNVDVVRVVDLRKVYSSGKVAVRNLAFSILPDEVFGFLGTNGAGKTTAISMLCQEFIPTSGNAYVCGYDVVTESREALQCIGYCPQFDATLDLLTVEEHLYLYAGIRGILYEERGKVVGGLMRLCGITEYRNTTSAQLSGGNRRKLSVALSLIGSPQVVFLDEPSAGMDPVARRGLWTAIQRVSQNCSVVLTTHHLEEVEELADTVAIMADGALRCIGDKIHLKQKYGSGFEMSIRIARKDMRVAVQRFVEKSFPEAVLNEFKGQRFVYALPQDTKLSEAFRQLQRNKERLHITDYSVSQTSIEQVFLRISEQQEEREELGMEKNVVHFVKSHATVHDYRGNATANRGTKKGRRSEEPAKKTVMVTSAAMEAYRRRRLAAGIAGDDALSAESGGSSRDDREESDEAYEAASTRGTATRRGAPAVQDRTSGLHSAPFKRKCNVANFVEAVGVESTAGEANVSANMYGTAAGGHGYGYNQNDGSPSAYEGLEQLQNNDNGYSYGYDYVYNNGGVTGHQQSLNPYASYYDEGDVQYS
ncbi:hypothetical protein LSCM4_06060 [Leishmania orientalis]|uniref:ABC transporter domain-containing protein n=1 Tax=Leishmania orientalis TaxID=2249476 RepID=A0A836KTT6_9TRYP|nr:hypothetical protein LSCM4_06060 [Leishmania orientalis]